MKNTGASDGDAASARARGARMDAATRGEFMAELARLNLQRLFWLLFVGILTRVVLLAVNHFSDASSEMFASMQWFDLICIPPLIWMTARLRRPGASTRLGWMLLLFVLWGTIGMGIIQALTSADDLGYRAIYVYGVMVVGIAYVVPPRLILPVYGIAHVVYIALVLDGDYDARFRLASLTDGTLGVLFAAGASWLLYRAKERDFLRERVIAAQNRELAARNAELATRQAETEELMAVVAHDMRSPLESLRGTLSFATELTPSANLRRALERGAEGCSYLLALATRLMESHASESRLRSQQTTRRDGRGLVEAAVDRVEGEAAMREVTLRSELPAGPALMEIDEMGLAQALGNLLANAVKFSPEGGVVTVTLARAADGDRWRISVADEGPGVPETERADIFKKFHRGERTKTGGQAGAGLGLFIAAKLVAAMGGEIGLGQARGAEAGGSRAGAVFWIELPAA